MDPADVDRRLTAHRLPAAGVELEVHVGGAPDAPLVVLLHGFPDAWWTWRHQVGPLLDAGYRVALPSMRGYGASGRPAGIGHYTLDELAADVPALADALGHRTFALVGHDWGGVVAWEVGIRHAGRVDRLAVLDAPHPDVWPRVALRHPGQVLRSAYVALFQLPRVPEALLAARGYALGRRSLTASSAPGTFSEADLDRYVDEWRRPGAMTAMLDYYRALRRKPRREPARVPTPTLVVWGGRDVALSRHVYDASLAMCDRGTGLWLDDATHWVHLEERGRVTGAILGHLVGP